jgi:hypothetical protein
MEKEIIIRPSITGFILGYSFRIFTLLLSISLLIKIILFLIPDVNIDYEVLYCLYSFSILIWGIELYSFNRIRLSETEIEGPSTILSINKRKIIPYSDIKLFTPINHNPILRFIIGYKFTSRNNECIRIFWLEENQIREIIKFIESMR